MGLGDIMMDVRKIPLCDICRMRDAEYVCKECGRLVCRVDFDYTTGLCRLCSKKLYPHISEYGLGLHSMFIPFILILVGMILIFLGFIYLSYPYLGSLSGGGSIVVIGPFPILLTGTLGIIVAAVYLLITLLILYILWRKMFR